jgi:hypothetical protein
MVHYVHYLLSSVIWTFIGLLVSVTQFTDGKLYDIIDIAPNLLVVVSGGVIGMAIGVLLAWCYGAHADLYEELNADKEH